MFIVVKQSCVLNAVSSAGASLLFIMLQTFLFMIRVWLEIVSCDSAADSDKKMANVRRENKLYSYQEQMAEIELRKASLLSLLIFRQACEQLFD